MPVDGIHMGLPTVHDQHLISGLGQKAGIYRTHGATTHDSNLHGISCQACNSRLAITFFNSGFSSRPKPGAAVGKAWPSQTMHPAG